MATVKIKMKDKVLRNLDRSVVAALEQTAEAVKTDVIQAEVIPFDSGTLQNESTFIDTSESSNGRVSIVSDTPYARKVYFHPEFAFRKDNNINATANWYDDWIDGGKKDFARRVFAKLYKKMTGV